MITRVRTIAAAFAIVSVVVSGCSATPATGAPSANSGVPDPSASAAAPGAVPLGSWTTTITEADLRAAGVTETGNLNENAGTFTMTLAEDGTWTVTQETDQPIRWPVFRGTYTVTGPTSFRQETEFPPDYAGDLVDFEWRIENGDLVLEVPDPPDPLLPIVMETHPWQPAG